MRRVILSKTMVTLYLEIKIALITCCQNLFQVFVLKERGCFSNTRWNSVCASVGANIFSPTLKYVDSFLCNQQIEGVPGEPCEDDLMLYTIFKSISSIKVFKH